MAIKTQSEPSIAASIARWLDTQPDVYYVRTTGVARKGTPDMVGNINGAFFAFEFKTSDGDPTALQSHTLSAIRSAGGEAHIIRSLEQAQVIVSYIRAGTART